jgi:hypothetical protein
MNPSQCRRLASKPYKGAQRADCRRVECTAFILAVAHVLPLTRTYTGIAEQRRRPAVTVGSPPPMALHPTKAEWTNPPA